ncbi:MAG: glutathione synthase [Methylovirgula sp.]|nr:glutathione synthase [Methylovirgula sp.]
MSLAVAVQMDPIDKINFAGDSTFALMLEAEKRGHALYHYTPDKLTWCARGITAEAAKISVRDRPGDYFTRQKPELLELAGVDVVLLRQDPPFDLGYISSTHLLEHLPPRVLVVNDPAAVRNAPEKLFVMEFAEFMPATLISRDKAAIAAFLEEHGEIVVKPLYGHGGAAVFKLSRKDPNFGSLYDLFAATFKEPWVAQEFLPQIAKGDKRIILVDGIAAGAVNRVPAENDIRANMVRGGAALATELTAREKAICAALGPELKSRGLLFVGIDVIDGYLTEINVTSPTGIRAIAQTGGPDVAAIIWDAIEARLRERRQETRA